MQTLLAAAAIAAAVAGSSLTATAWWAYDTYVDDPRVAELERERLTREFEAAAAAAMAAEQLRQFKIGERAYQQFYLEQREDDAWSAAARNLFGMELADYERRLAEAGGACSLSQLDIDYLDGRLVQPGAPLPSGP